MKCTLALVLVACAKFTIVLSAQHSGLSPVGASLEREATRLAATLATHEQPSASSRGFDASAAQIDRSHDWDAVRRLKDGTRVLVSTGQERGLEGSVTAVSDDELQIVVRRGRLQTLRRDDVREVRLDHRLSIGQHVGLGLLVGGVTGYLIGSAVGCDPRVCGGEGGLAIAGGTLYGTFTGGLGGFVVGHVVHSRSARLVYARATP